MPVSRRVSAGLVAVPAVLVLLLFGCSKDSTAPEPPPDYTIRALTLTPEDESSPALSPDGARVAFVRGGAIVVKDVSSGGETLAAPHGDSPQWGADTSTLYYVRRDTGPVIHRLVRRDLGSGDETVVSADTIDVYEPSVELGGRRVVYRALSRTTLKQNLRLLNLETDSEIDLTDPSSSWTDGDPSMMPGGRVVFVRLFPDGTSRICWVAGAEDAFVAFVTGAQPNFAGPTGNWPAGNRVVFSRNGALAIVPVGGGSPSVFVDAPGFAQAPDFGVDGTSLVYVSNRFGNFDVFVLRRSGGLGDGPYSP
jgi:hypothetical protein